MEGPYAWGTLPHRAWSRDRAGSGHHSWKSCRRMLLWRGWVVMLLPLLLFPLSTSGAPITEQHQQNGAAIARYLSLLGPSLFVGIPIAPMGETREASHRVLEAQKEETTNEETTMQVLWWGVGSWDVLALVVGIVMVSMQLTGGTDNLLLSLRRSVQRQPEWVQPQVATTIWSFLYILPNLVVLWCIYIIVLLRRSDIPSSYASPHNYHLVAGLYAAFVGLLSFALGNLAGGAFDTYKKARALLVELRVKVQDLVAAVVREVDLNEEWKWGREERLRMANHELVQFRDAFSQRRRLFGAIELFIHTVFKGLYVDFNGEGFFHFGVTDSREVDALILSHRQAGFKLLKSLCEELHGQELHGHVDEKVGMSVAVVILCELIFTGAMFLAAKWPIQMAALETTATNLRHLERGRAVSMPFTTLLLALVYIFIYSLPFMHMAPDVQNEFTESVLVQLGWMSLLAYAYFGIIIFIRQAEEVFGEHLAHVQLHLRYIEILKLAAADSGMIDWLMKTDIAWTRCESPNDNYFIQDVDLAGSHEIGHVFLSKAVQDKYPVAAVPFADFVDIWLGYDVVKNQVWRQDDFIEERLSICRSTSKKISSCLRRPQVIGRLGVGLFAWSFIMCVQLSIGIVPRNWAAALRHALLRALAKGLEPVFSTVLTDVKRNLGSLLDDRLHASDTTCEQPSAAWVRGRDSQVQLLAYYELRRKIIYLFIAMNARLRSSTRAFTEVAWLYAIQYTNGRLAEDIYSSGDMDLGRLLLEKTVTSRFNRRHSGYRSWFVLWSWWYKRFVRGCCDGLTKGLEDSIKGEASSGGSAPPPSGGAVVASESKDEHGQATTSMAPSASSSV